MGLSILLGQKPTLYINGRSRKTLSSIWIVIGLFILFGLAALIILGQDIVRRDDPQVTISKEFVELPPITKLGPDTFNIRFGAFDPFDGKLVQDPRFFTIELFQGYVKDPESSTEFEFDLLEIGECTNDNYGEILDKSTPLLCIASEQETDMPPSFGGRLEAGRGEYREIGLLVRLCDEDFDEGIECASPEEMDEFFEFVNPVFMIEYIKNEFDPFNFEEPKRRTLKMITHQLNQYVMADGFLALDETVVQTDDGFFTTRHYNQSYPTVGYFDRGATGSMRGELFSLFIGSSGDKQVYHRSYIKIADIFAQVEGIASAVLVVLIILIYPYLKIKYYEDIFNSLYDYDDNTQQYQIRIAKGQLISLPDLKFKNLSNLKPYEVRESSKQGDEQQQQPNERDVEEGKKQEQVCGQQQNIRTQRIKGDDEIPKSEADDFEMHQLQGECLEECKTQVLSPDQQKNKFSSNASSPEQILVIDDDKADVVLRSQQNIEKSQSKLVEGSGITKEKSNNQLGGQFTKLMTKNVTSSTESPTKRANQRNQTSQINEQISDTSPNKNNLRSSNIEDSPQAKKESDKNKKPLHISYFECIRYVFRCSRPETNQKIQLLKQGKRVIRKELDVARTLRKLKDFEHLQNEFNLLCSQLRQQDE